MLSFEFQTDPLDGELLLIYGASWVAEILGRDRTYRYERRFITTRVQPEDLPNANGERPFRITLQDCAGVPVFLQCAEGRTLRSYWKVERTDGMFQTRYWLHAMVSEKEMRVVLAQGRSRLLLPVSLKTIEEAQELLKREPPAPLVLGGREFYLGQ